MTQENPKNPLLSDEEVNTIRTTLPSLDKYADEEARRIAPADRQEEYRRRSAVEVVDRIVEIIRGKGNTDVGVRSAVLQVVRGQDGLSNHYGFTDVADTQVSDPDEIHGKKLPNGYRVVVPIGIELMPSETRWLDSGFSCVLMGNSSRLQDKEALMRPLKDAGFEAQCELILKPSGEYRVYAK